MDRQTFMADHEPSRPRMTFIKLARQASAETDPWQKVGRHVVLTEKLFGFRVYVFSLDCCPVRVCRAPTTAAAGGGAAPHHTRSLDRSMLLDTRSTRSRSSPPST